MKDHSESLAAFGPVAAQWSSRLPTPLAAIVADPTGAAAALAKAAEWRLAGRDYFTSILLDDRRASVAAALAPLILAQVGDIEQRIAHFDLLASETLKFNGAQQQTLTTVDASAAATLRHLFQLADNILVRSWTEYNRLSDAFSEHRHNVRVCAPSDPDVPEPQPRTAQADSIVIWGPRMPSGSLALLCFALEELHTPVIVVSADGAPLPLRAQVVTPASGREALAHALVVVDASLTDPGTATALCAYDVPVVTGCTSGAHEHIAPHYVYYPWNWRSVRSAVSKAMGTRAPVRREADGSQIALGSPVQSTAEQPLVSIITPTYNRRERLAESLLRWSKQAYANIEVVLINDGGERVDDLAAKYPFVRLINLETNQGATRALNIGAQSATGKYILLSADDDVFAPDHVVNLVGALERTGQSVAHSNVIIRHEELGSDGRYRIYGYSLDWNNTMDPSRVLATAVVAITGTMVSRDAFFQAGGWDEQLPILRDYQFILNLAKTYDFVHVDCTSAVYSSRPDASSMGYRNQEQIADALRTIYARNPVQGRPSIEQWRQMEIAHYEGRKGTALFEPPMRLYPKE